MAAWAQPAAAQQKPVPKEPPAQKSPGQKPPKQAPPKQQSPNQTPSSAQPPAAQTSGQSARRPSSTLGTHAQQAPATADRSAKATLREALSAATGEHPNIAQARAQRKQAEARRKQARAHFGPTLSASANAQLWNDEIVFSASPGGGGAAPNLPPPSDPYEQAIAGLFTETEPTVVRDQFTWDFSLTITQPLGPLWSVYYSWRAAEFGEDAAEQQVDQASRDQARQVATSYFRVLQARASRRTAKQSVEQLQAQVKRLEALVEAGAAKPADKLRIQVALASARQQVLQATSRVRLARSNLAVAMGKSSQKAVGAEDVGSADLPGLESSPEAAVDAAVEGCPELRQLQRRIDQAQASVDVQRGNYIPQLVAIGQYAHSAGQGLTGSDNLFIGLSLSWDIWEWGADYYAVDAAQSQVVQLQESYIQSRRQIGLQVKTAWYDLQSAVQAYSVAQSAVDQAEEAYRVQRVRYEAGEATPTDLLDAQSALTEARNNLNNALYQALIQNTELIYATGQPITADRLLRGGNQ